MINKTATYKSPPVSRVKSNIKFDGDFKKELKQTIEHLWIDIEKDPYMAINGNSIETWRNAIKLRIYDDLGNHERMNQYIFRYHHDDEWYGNVHIEVVTTGFSESSATDFLWTFWLKDYKKILEIILKNLKK
jgi:hypothetical protein